MTQSGHGAVSVAEQNSSIRRRHNTILIFFECLGNRWLNGLSVVWGVQLSERTHGDRSVQKILDSSSHLSQFPLYGCMASGGRYVCTDEFLVSNIPGLATLTDPNLQNPWCRSHLPTSLFWVSDQVTNVSTLYNVTGSTTITANPLVVTIPTTASGPPQGPTGQVSNTNTSSFLVNGVAGAAANFIFANLNGTISARNAGSAAFIQATTPGAVYTGLAINQAGTQLYAANGAQNRIDVFNSSFSSVSLGPTAFATPASIPTTFVPFNVQALNGEIYVTYAPSKRAIGNARHGCRRSF